MTSRARTRKTKSASSAYESKEFSSWSNLKRHLESMALRGWLFRGQEDASWPLKSSLARELERRRIPKRWWRSQEERTIRLFQRKAHLLLSRTPADLFEWLALMQHHGAPTRLLDFTWSPHVAAFFALDRAQKKAAIWALRTSAFPQADNPYDHSRSEDRTLPDGLLPVGIRPWNKDVLAVRLLTNRERTAFWGAPYHMNQRLVVQSGTFVVPGVLAEPVEDIVAGLPGGRAALQKIVVRTTARNGKTTLRQEAMRSLYNMNVTYESLFPGLDGLARSLNLELEL
jgi:hypothetical protein